jgi:multidrug efflux pump subunit AcrA (membrane-fusion protein)
VSIFLLGTILVLAGAAFWRKTPVDSTLTAPVQKGTLVTRLTMSGVLKPAQAITYRSPLGGRETEVTFLVPEGTRVNEGDLTARLDTTDIRRELDRASQELRQAQVDLKVAEIEEQDGRAAIDSIVGGEGALSVDEVRTRLQLAQTRVERLHHEQDALKPLLDKGFITREELRKTSDELEQAEEELTLARRKLEILVEQTHPRDRQRAQLQLAQKQAQLENVRTRVHEAQARVKLLQDQIEDCNVYARRPGMVVYEEYLGANPRRKIRVGDRVTGSQGLLTIPEVRRMLVEASATEADVHRVRPGQSATIRLEAFPDVQLTGKVTRVGTLARAASDRPLEDKRFDIVVEVDPTEADLRPEMTARVDLSLGERPDVLLVPINAVFERQGLPVCHVVGRFGIDTRLVQIGDSNDAFVEVVAGLREGERVGLQDVGGSTAPVALPGATASGLKSRLPPGFTSSSSPLAPR